MSHPSLAKAPEVWDDIAEDLRKRNELFLDDEFSTTGASLYYDPTKPPSTKNLQAPAVSDVVWLRPEEMFGVGTPKLFWSDGSKDIRGLDMKGVAPTDVVQGALDDRWLLSALSMTARTPTVLAQVFKCIEYGPSLGLFVIQFFKNGNWVPVIVDNRIPCHKSGPNARRPIFSQCKNTNEYWVMIVEKAYAKLHGCYEALSGGEIEYALKDLTGGTHNLII